MNRRAEILGELARELCFYNGCFEDLVYVYDNLEDLIEVSGKSGEEIARATFFGDIKSWNDDLFFIDSCGNFGSCSEKDQEADILIQEEDIINTFLDEFKDSDTLEDFREQLEELGIDIDNLD